MAMIANQLELCGLEEALRRADAEGATPRERQVLRDRLETAHLLLSELPSQADLAFMHSGLCQTALPHSRPADDAEVWERRSGRFSLLVRPGVIDREQPGTGGRAAAYVGVPYGPKARLILIHLQSEGLRSRTVPLGASLSAFMRSLGLAVTGGERGTINAVREQALRIARCTFTMQWTEASGSGSRTLIRDTPILDGLELIQADGQAWAGTVVLSAAFHEQLREHAVPLDKRAIAKLSANSLGLDLYALFAYRLPRLTGPLELRWRHLQSQMGTEQRETQGLARRVREVLPTVLAAYPQAQVDVTSSGLILRPSPPAVPRTMVQGARLVGLAAS